MSQVRKQVEKINLMSVTALETEYAVPPSVQCNSYDAHFYKAYT